MKFSAQEEYGLRCLLQIARLGDGGWLTISEISQEEGLTEANVAKILMVLRKADFIKSARGHAGGYALSRPAEQIRVGDVLAALGGKLYDGDFCGKYGGTRSLCARAVSCQVRSLWQTVQAAVDEVLDNLTVADLLKTEVSDPAPLVWFDAPPRPGQISEAATATEG